MPDRPMALADEPLGYPALSSIPSRMNFLVQLDRFRGPLDLLLYLVRKHELEVTEIPLSAVTDQFLEHLSVLEELDVDSVGEFLEVASVLIEIKSRSVLPREPEPVEEAEDEVRDQLVQRLLDYKKYKDAASLLEDGSQQWQQRYHRLADDLPPRTFEPSEQPLQEVQIWDLVSALGRMVRQSQQQPSPTMVYDETPIQVYMQHIHDRLLTEQRFSFSGIFQPGMHKSALIGIFLAALELVRNYQVAIEQDDLHGEIWIAQGPEFQPRLEVTEIHETATVPAAEKPIKPR
jgi:segregation and condensation protein A